jgi:hypothetical protein
MVICPYPDEAGIEREGRIYGKRIDREYGLWFFWFDERVGRGWVDGSPVGETSE